MSVDRYILLACTCEVSCSYRSPFFCSDFLSTSSIERRVVKMSDVKREQRIVIKFLVKLGDKPAEIVRKLNDVYKHESLSKTRVFEWARRFKEGRESVEDDEREGAPATTRTDENVDRLWALVTADRRMTLRILSYELGINKESVRIMLHENLGMRKLCAKVVPKNLTAEQKELRLSICRDMLERIDTEGRDWMNRVITGDETWVFQYDPETRRQSMQWVEAEGERPTKARMSRSQFKSMLICFFDSTGLIHKEFVPPGQTVNAAFYVSVLERLRQRVVRIRPNLVAHGWILHHDNAPAHTAMVVNEFLAKKQIPTLSHPPYSPDLAPSDFFLFPKIKSTLKGHHFEDIDDIQRNTTRVLNDLTSEDYLKCFQSWEERWRKCVALKGQYCEGMNA